MNGIIIKTCSELMQEGIDEDSLVAALEGIYQRNLRNPDTSYIRDYTGKFADFLHEKDMTFLLAMADGKPVGFALLVYPDEGLQEANVRLLGIDREYRGRGIGNALVAACEEHTLSNFPACEKMTTNTWIYPSLNMGTFMLATGRGYGVSIRKNFFPAGYDIVDFGLPVRFIKESSTPDARAHFEAAARVREGVKAGRNLYQVLGVVPDTPPGPTIP